MNPSIDKTIILNISKYGTYYNPATSHYIDNATITNVICDRCYKDHLNISIGWGAYDLCLSCIAEINNANTNNISDENNNKKRMMQRQYRK